MTTGLAATRDDTLAHIKRQLDATAGGPGIQENVKRHYEHLEKLAASLRRLGMDEREISDEIMEVFRRYEQVLTDYMQTRQ
jgi:hypothetical protein